jgi:signal transduction histidine kinase/DNA-binding response OmpR family regulator
MSSILSIDIGREHDVMMARQRARQIAGLVGFDQQDQVRVATAVSEMARNAFRHGGGGTVSFSLEGRTAPQLLRIVVTDRGPGLQHLDEILEGRFRSESGVGLGIAGTRRLMDRFEMQSRTGEGTTVTLGKLLPPRVPVVGPGELRRLTDHLAAERPAGLLEEIQAQNRELLRTLDELRSRQEELERLNRELEDTNRGVVALYAELDERADHLRRADEMKSRFLSNMSHEFRTPLNSILALSKLLCSRVDGDLTAEQETQVRLIRKSAQDLSELVSDLLDLAKVEAGKIVVRPAPFEVANLFGALRGMLRPLLVSEAVRLVFEEPVDVPTLETDEGKVSQILRNFISNALKFTERGDVRVRVCYRPEDGHAVFSVSDTGIGIAPEDHERIFLEFTQLESPLQRSVRGTGLGLPLSRRLAELLGGHIDVVSAVGTGSTFSASLPAVYRSRETEIETEATVADWTRDAARQPVLVVEDAPDALLLYDRFLRGTGWQLVPARTLREARQALARVVPAAIVLDILLHGEDTWRFLAELKQAEATRDVPVLIVSTVDDQRKGLALGADDYAVKPIEREWLLLRLDALARGRDTKRVLVIDDDEHSRYVLRRHMTRAWQFTEATTGAEGLRVARAEHPDLVVLDLVMPGLDGSQVLAALRSDPATRAIPVIVATSRTLDGADREALARLGATVLPKSDLAGEDASGRMRDALVRAGVLPSANGVEP